MLHRANRFLTALGGDLELLRPHLREVTLRAGQILAEPGEPVRNIYFLHHGVVSKLAVFEDGAEIECALVGREGAVGVTALLGLRHAITRDICHLETRASVIETSFLRDASQQSPRVHDLVDRYCAHKMSQAMRNGACNARHPVEQRLCRWLLTCSDVLEAKEIRLSQDVFAKMLGVQRTSINPILQRLKAEGLIALGRARLTIVDRPGLIARGCECYEAMRLNDDLLAPPTISAATLEDFSAPTLRASPAPQNRRSV